MTKIFEIDVNENGSLNTITINQGAETVVFTTEYTNFTLQSIISPKGEKVEVNAVTEILADYKKAALPPMLTLALVELLETENGMLHGYFKTAVKEEVAKHPSLDYEFVIVLIVFGLGVQLGVK